MFRFDARTVPELRATIVALRSVGPDLRKAMYKATRETVGQMWKGELAGNAATSIERAVLVKGARVRTGLDGFTLLAATSRRPLSGGLIPSDSYAGAEWGATPRSKEVTMTSRRGRRFTRRQIINRQFRRRAHEGRVAMEAASTTGTKMVAAWVTAVVRTLAAAADGEVTR